MGERSAVHKASKRQLRPFLWETIPFAAANPTVSARGYMLISADLSLFLPFHFRIHYFNTFL